MARRISFTGAMALTVVLLGICTVMSSMSTSRAREAVIAWVGEKTQSIADSIDAFDMTARVTVDKLSATFAQDMAGTFSIDDGELKLFGDKLFGNFMHVDRFQRNTGGIAAVYVKKGDDFMLVTTSLKSDDDKRALGTMLGQQHAAYPAVSTGKPYTGRAMLHGRTFMTHFKPVNDEKNQLAGLLFVAYDMSAFEAALEKMVAQTRFFDSGGVYVIDPKQTLADATIVMHPNARGARIADVAADADKRLADAHKAQGGWVMAAPAVLSKRHGDAWAVVRQSRATGLWVIAEVSDRQAMKSHWASLVAFWAMLGGATLALGFGLFWMMNRWVAQPMRKLSAAVTAVANGDLTHPVHSRRTDEIGALIRDVESMRVRFGRMMGSVRSTVDSIGTASAEIASGNADLSARAEQAAGNLQQTASSMEQLTGTVRQSADAARTANQLASSAAAVAAKGGQVVSQVVSTMNEINVSSKKISDIIGVIDGIAFQTNILALNAAVEAARAGEQGRGFAVVAGEVRSLAQRSAEAAKEIKGLIGTSVDKVASGSKLVRDAGSTMNEIVASVQRVTDIIGEISAAASEQSEGIGQVNTAVTQLDQMTQQNASLVQESAAAAESLKQQASRLASAVSAFKLRSDDLEEAVRS